ncbi:MAG TPA: hypothetical protein VMM36_13680 [Opitutaceae bacterium]|nr:hypothetical protein [Opitutaceae bacterium]
MADVPQSEHVRIANQRQIAIIRAMTPQERLRQSIRMSGTMRELLAAGFRDRHPAWSAKQVAGAVADRILHARTG